LSNMESDVGTVVALLVIVALVALLFWSISVLSYHPPLVPRGAEGVVALAREDLQGRVGAQSLGEVRVVEVRTVNWSDSCIGHYRPDIMCAQVITPGYLIFLGVGDRVFEYHSDSGSRVVFIGEAEK
jgi:hypothetical protein